MKKRLIIYLLVAGSLLVLLLFIIVFRSQQPSLVNNPTVDIDLITPVNINNDGDPVDPPTIDGEPLINLMPETVYLAVPYINETLDSAWTGPWKNACEEAVITMVEKYYLGDKTVTKEEAREFMQMLFDKQDELWGTNFNADAARMAQLIDDYTSYGAKVVDDPTLESIKVELQNNQPIIALHYGFDLKNSNIPFMPLPRGTSYHTTVIIGYDDKTKEFITNDPGDTVNGPNHRYDYDLFLNSLHDYSFSTKQADGPARVIFTSSKSNQ
ncbi:MAG: C39 family peptidase [Patescibacteria group bacterium]